MARPRTFDETAVLDAAAGEFRVHGFADTSTERLCRATGVLRGSLYNAFVSKDELFVRTLEHYADHFRALQADILTDQERTGGERLRAVMDVILEEESNARRNGHGAGCMVVQTMMNPQLRKHDQRIARILDQDLRERLSLLEGAIRAGLADGSVPREVDPRTGALQFVTVLNGIRTMGLAGIAPDALKDAALAGIATLTA